MSSRFVAKLKMNGFPQSCKSPQRFLFDLAIINKHASLRGMPKVSENEAAEIAKMVLTLKGVNSKAKTEALKEGRLSMTGKGFTYRVILKREVLPQHWWTGRKRPARFIRICLRNARDWKAFAARIAMTNLM